MHGDSNTDSHLKGLIDEVTQAGFWAMWMGAGVLKRMVWNADSKWNDASYGARRLTGHISKVLRSAEVR
jgi:hypothetical protein